VPWGAGIGDGKRFGSSSLQTTPAGDFDFALLRVDFAGVGDKDCSLFLLEQYSDTQHLLLGFLCF
ncbi:MAG: hypothetical protein K2G93_04390, partial [Rikenella sp.]|nr:hypothetical protein [Rikenella sp.]